jgi:16S rRNA (cytidine1402-2'-O)-methyltransferase
MPTGKLYLIPCLLGGEDTAIIPELNKKVLREISVFAVENLRSARRFLRSMNYDKNFDSEVFFIELNKHHAQQNFSPLFQAIREGKHAGIISEAGNPCVADPGNQLVAMAHQLGIEVMPLVGPSSILLALSASGFNGQQFCFHGYLPIDATARTKKIKHLQQEVVKNGITQIFMETPYRNQKLFEELLQTLQPETQLCIAADLTLATQWVSTKTISEWRKFPTQLHKRLVIFLLGCYT